jgi:glycosyltransferase involved in cell wall biosynthesis
MAGGRLSGVPLVSTFFGVELTWLRRQFPFLAPVARRIIRGSDAVTVISTHTAREVRRLVPDARVRTIPFGAAISPLPRPDLRVPTPERPSPPAPFNLLFIGRLVERKGVTFLLRAVAAIQEQGGDVRLRVVGDGPLREPLWREVGALGIADAVEFMGFIPSSALTGAIAECDVLVLPAVQDSKGDVEGLGVVLIEAMMHDRPVIASDSGGISDIVIDGESGLLVPPGDVGALVSAIERLRDDPQLRNALATRGRAHAEERFSWDRIVDDLQTLYGELGPRTRTSHERH